MNHVSREHQKNVLEKRAQALATAISGKFDIEPLEARLYYPKQSIRDAIKGTDHDCCAALILATDKAHASALEEARKHIIEERANARAKAKNDKHLLPTSPPSDASVETMLSMHRKPATEGKKAEAILQDEYIGLREIVSYASTSPTIVARNEKRKFPISLHGSKELVDPKDLKVDNGTTHVLILPLNQAIVSCVPPGIKLPKDIREIGVAFDEQRVREAIHPIATFLKKTISSHVSYSNKGEPFLCLRTSGEDQEKTLISCKHMFNSCIAKYRAEEADWRNYLDERHIEHRPPSAAR